MKSSSRPVASRSKYPECSYGVARRLLVSWGKVLDPHERVFRVPANIPPDR